MACLLLLGCMVPATALCAGEHAPKRSRGKGHDRPYSEAMYVKRQGGDLYISAKLDERTDITYWFRRCMFNELYTFYRVGITRNRAALPPRSPRPNPPSCSTRRTATTSGLSPSPGAGGAGATTNTGNARRARHAARVTPCWPTAPHRGRHDAMGKSGDGRGRKRNPRPNTPLPERRGRRRTARHPVPGIGDIHCPPQQHRGRGLAPVLQRRARDHRHLLRDAVDVRRRDARTHPGRGLHGLDGSGEGIDVHQTGIPLSGATSKRTDRGTNRPGCCPTGWETTRCWTGRTTSSSMRPTARATTSS